jgi:hypothetical protein
MSDEQEYCTSCGYKIIHADGCRTVGYDKHISGDCRPGNAGSYCGGCGAKYRTDHVCTKNIHYDWEAIGNSMFPNGWRD